MSCTLGRSPSLFYYSHPEDTKSLCLFFGVQSAIDQFQQRSKKFLLNYYYSLGGVTLLSEFLGLWCCRKFRQSASTKLPDHGDTARSGGFPTANYIEFSYSSGGFLGIFGIKGITTLQAILWIIRRLTKDQVSLCWMCVCFKINMAREFILNLFD